MYLNVEENYDTDGSHSLIVCTISTEVIRNIKTLTLIVSNVAGK